MIGCKSRRIRTGCRRPRPVRAGINLFIEDGAYTTVAAAVTILVVLTLLFSSATAVWTMSRSGDVQASADATAMAGANVVSSYYTIATTVDAVVLSMGLTGFISVGAGLVGTLVPGMRAGATELVHSGVRVLQARNDLCASASRGLSRLEEGLPYLVAARGTRICGAQGGAATEYAGTALAVPRESDSSFPSLEGPAIELGGVEGAADALGEVAASLEDAREESARAKERAWLADCGRDGMNMQERAGKLSGISAAENPDFSSSLTWDPSVGLERARAYYRWRADNEAPEGAGVEAGSDSAARKAFYEYACGELDKAYVGEEGGNFKTTLDPLPRNTDEIRDTTLYTEARWPSSVEGVGVVLHGDLSCPGVTGVHAGPVALCDIEKGYVHECSVCGFGVADVGRVPAASTSIDNGFEYHFREYTLALKDYEAARDKERELEERARGVAGKASTAFDEALEGLKGERPRIAPPGRFGCIALVASSPADSPEDLSSPFAPRARATARGAIAGAALAPDEATQENNVLASFLSSVSADGGLLGLADELLGAWGELLLAYGNAGERVGSALDDLLGQSGGQDGETVGGWLEERIHGALEGLGLEPVNLSLRKPVLTDSANIIQRGDVGSLESLQQKLRSIAPSSSDPAAILQAVGYEVENALLSTEVVVAEIPLPQGGSIPLTVRLGDIVRSE